MASPVLGAVPANYPRISAPRMFTFAHNWVSVPKGRQTLRPFRVMQLQAAASYFDRPAQPCPRLYLLEPRLSESHTTVVIPLDHSIIFVSSLNCAEFPGRLSDGAQPRDPI